MPDSTQPPPVPDDPTDTAADRVRRNRHGGVWVARYKTAGGAHIFGNEIDALRFAVSDEGAGREVLWGPYGEDVTTYERPRGQRPPVMRSFPNADRV